MLAHLQGAPVPELPAVPGRVHVVAVDDDVLTPDDKTELLMSDCTDLEVGKVLGVSRQRVNQLRQALRQRLATEDQT